MQARRTTFLPLLLLIFAAFICFSPTAQAQDTIQVKTGWNIIGSVKAGAVPDVLSTDPPGIITTEFYGYNPGTGYESTDTLGKGFGYWVKVSGDGIIVFNTASLIYTGCGVKRVEYGGVSYGTVQIGSQCWLSENLNVGTMVAGVTNQTDNATLEKYCYADNMQNCGIYGGLYRWDEAMQYDTTEGAQGICPPGWHIPTKEDLDTLSSTVVEDGNALKKGGVGLGTGSGTNTSGFSVLLSGYRHSDHLFYDLGTYAMFWSSTQAPTGADILYLFSNVASVFRGAYSKDLGFSVRCIED